MRKIQVLTGLVLCLLLAAGIMADSGIIREPAVSGLFYPSDPDELRDMVRAHLDAVDSLPQIQGKIKAIIVPHAGLIYSGAIAAHAYALLEDKAFTTAVLLGPSHKYPLRKASVYGPGVTWRTPLGTIDCDDQLCQHLLNQRYFEMTPEAHLQEHSLEVQLPYLQTVLPHADICPITLGRPDAMIIKGVAQALSDLPDGDSTILIASSDWQHYRSARQGWPMDSLGISCIEALDPGALINYITSGKVEACGGAAVTAVMQAAIERGANAATILRYGHSGETSGENSQVVGYVAAVLYENTAGPGSKASYISDNDKKLLLKVARQTLELFLRDSTRATFDVPDHLQQPGAAFVTLNKHQSLRGCIGFTQAVTPLVETISQCAIEAALHDPRFPPVDYSELDQIEIEVSVLTPLQRVDNLENIEVGRDGLMISFGGRRGLLLPQVASEYGWTREEFLRQTCRKAGLAPDTYLQPGVRIFSFQAIVFAEADK